jgi:hypothetical protein
MIEISSDGRLIGSKGEIRRFKRDMFIWKHKRGAMVVMGILSFLPIFICTHIVTVLAAMVFTLFLTISRPTRHPVFNHIKDKLLVPGMIMELIMDYSHERRDTASRYFTYGTYREYDEVAKLHIIQDIGKVCYYEYEDISPLYWPECYEALRH